MFFTWVAAPAGMGTTRFCAATGVQPHPTYSIGSLNNTDLLIKSLEAFHALWTHWAIGTDETSVIDSPLPMRGY